MLDAALSLLDRLTTSPPLQAALVVVVAVLLSRALSVAFGALVLRSAGRRPGAAVERAVALLRRPVEISVVLFGLWVATTLLALPPRWEGLTLSALRTVAIVVWIAFVAGALTQALALASRPDRPSRLVQPQTLALFQNLARVMVVAVGAYLLFLAWHINVTAWLASAGIIGIAVGFAAKDTLANLFAGIFILADAPYKLGDFINLDSGERGQVTQIGLRSTRLLTRDDVEITIPNAVIANAKIVNESGGPSEQERLRIKVSVAYGSDVDHVRELLVAVAAKHPDVASRPEPRMRFRSFGDSGLQLELLVWIDEPVLRGRIIDSLNTEIYKAFAAAGIEIPYPKRDVTLRWADGATAAIVEPAAPAAEERPG
jgi:MscS family membrane protein